MQTKPKDFYDDLIEPKPLCGNCDSTAPTNQGQICTNTRSPKFSQVVREDGSCGKWFWPCSKRWPDCDHD